LQLPDKHLFVDALLGTRPGFEEDIPYGNAQKYIAVFCFVQAESILVNIAEIFSVFIEDQMLAGIIVGGSATIAAAKACVFKFF